MASTIKDVAKLAGSPLQLLRAYCKINPVSATQQKESSKGDGNTKLSPKCQCS